MSTQSTSSEPVIVELVVSKIDVANIEAGGEELIAWRDTQVAVLEVALAWATVRGHERLLPGLSSMLEPGYAPESGYHLMINKPTSLAFLATWPWAPPRFRRAKARH